MTRYLRALTALSLLGAAAACSNGSPSAPTSTTSSKVDVQTLRGNVTLQSYSVGKPVVIARAENGRTYFSAVKPGGEFAVTVPTGVAYRLSLGKATASGGYIAFSRVLWPGSKATWAKLDATVKTIDLGTIQPATSGVGPRPMGAHSPAGDDNSEGAAGGAGGHPSGDPSGGSGDPQSAGGAPADGASMDDPHSAGGAPADGASMDDPQRAGGASADDHQQGSRDGDQHGSGGASDGDQHSSDKASDGDQHSSDKASDGDHHGAHDGDNQGDDGSSEKQGGNAGQDKKTHEGNQDGPHVRECAAMAGGTAGAAGSLKDEGTHAGGSDQTGHDEQGEHQAFDRDDCESDTTPVCAPDVQIESQCTGDAQAVYKDDDDSSDAGSGDAGTAQGDATDDGKGHAKSAKRMNDPVCAPQPAVDAMPSGAAGAGGTSDATPSHAGGAPATGAGGAPASDAGGAPASDAGGAPGAVPALR